MTVAGCRLLLVHLINLLRILLRYGFAKIQKAVAIRLTVDCQTLELLGPATELVVIQIHFSSHVTIHLDTVLYCCQEKRWHSKLIFLNCGQLRDMLLELFHLSSLLQMLNDHTVVDAEFFGTFLCSCNRISFDDDC